MVACILLPAYAWDMGSADPSQQSAAGHYRDFLSTLFEILKVVCFDTFDANVLSTSGEFVNRSSSVQSGYHQYPPCRGTAQEHKAP